MSKPTIVCVPGAWHTPEIYTKVFEHLNAEGYPTVGQALPSVNPSERLHGFEPDVLAIRTTLKKLIEDEEKEVVLVTHSYSGMPGSEAPVGLGRKEREAKGLKGGVIRMVFIMAFVPSEGFNPVKMMNGWPDFMKHDEERGVIVIDKADAKRLWYNDLEDEEAELWASRIGVQSLGVYDSTTTYAAWRYIPSTFVFPTNDKSLPGVPMEGFVNMVIDAARAVEPTALDIIERCDAGHCVMISKPDWLAGVLRRAACETV